MTCSVLVTGAAGYLGVPTCRELTQAGFEVRGLDLLIHEQEEAVQELGRTGVELLIGDIRDRQARRRALEGVEAVVHLAAIVGDPACAREPDLSEEVNVVATRALAAEAQQSGAQRMIFASTCSNYGRMADPSVPVDETTALAPVSRYAEQKVQIERELLRDGSGHLQPTCLRFATIYGVAPRMRFDLTVNEFTRDLCADRVLEVFGEQFWRPYVHVNDAARGIRAVLEAQHELVDTQVFNVGCSSENYRKMDLVEEIKRQVSTGTVRYVSREQDPRDYKVSFERIRSVLGYETERTVPDGIAETASALAAGLFTDPYHRRYRNTP